MNTETNYLKNHWYAVAIGSELKAGSLKPVVVLGRPIVLFRGASGQASALEDRCPHRNVALSLGSVVGETLQCGYHGLQFDNSGACVKLCTSEPPPRGMVAAAYPLIERHGYLWAWMGVPALADDDLVPDYSWQDAEGWAGRLTSTVTKCSYVLALENVLDLSHAAFVHGETVGSPEGASTMAEVASEGDTVTITRRFLNQRLKDFYERATGWQHADRVQKITYFGNNCVTLEVAISPVGSTDPSKRKLIRFGGPYTPSAPNSHLHFSSAFHNFNIEDEALSESLISIIKRAYAEDVDFLENQQRYLDERISQPNRLFSVDKGPAVAMRMLRAKIVQEQSLVAEPVKADLERIAVTQ